MLTKQWSKVVAVFVMATMMNLMAGCSIQDTKYPTADDENTPVAGAAENETYSDDFANVDLLTTFGVVGQTSIDKVLNSPFVRPYLDEFNAQGYHFAPGYSYAVEAYVHTADTTDSIAISIVEVAMISDTDTTRAAYVRYFKSEVGHIITPYLLSFMEPDEGGFEYVTEGIWQMFLPGEVVPAIGKTRQRMAANLDSYLDCVETETAAGCATALTACAFSGAAYPECVAGGCAAALVASVVHCAFEELSFPPGCDQEGIEDPWCEGGLWV
ncbi:MAG: hypothetical protein ACE5K8_04055 [Candidatus Zixiibacteriota bacterium]